MRCQASCKAGNQTNHNRQSRIGAVSDNDEFEPYVLYRVEGAQFECALWRMPNGQSALALFLTSDSAVSYREALRLGNDWKVFRPGKVDLVQILKTGYHNGIASAVLDPDLEAAKYVFALEHVLNELGALPGEP